MCRQMRLFSGWVLVLFMGVGWLPVASGQRLLVVSQARNALGEASRLSLHNVDLDLVQVEPGPLALSGTTLAAPLLLDRQHAGLFVSSGLPWAMDRTAGSDEVAQLASFHTVPLAPWLEADTDTAPGWREWPVEVAEDQETLSNVLVTARFQADERGEWHGALATRPWPPEGLYRRVQAQAKVLALPLAPRFVVPVGPMDYLVVGTTGPEDPLRFLRVQLEEEIVGAPVPFSPTGHRGDLSQLRRVLVDPARRVLWALFSDLILGDTGMVPRSWLYVIDTETQVPVGPPLEIPGIGAADESPLALDAQGRCWVATREPGTDFGHVTRVGREGVTQLPERQQHTALVGVQHQIRVVPAPEGGHILVAFDRHLEFWPDGLRQGHKFSGESLVSALQWSSAGVVLAEGNHLHRIAVPTCVAEASVSLQSGWALDFVVVPPEALPTPDSDGDGVVDDDERKQQSNPQDPDTDHDGIPDGRDPHPNAPSPQLVVPAEITFPYAAVGRQLRALHVESPGAPEARWNISYDQEALPWLRIHPSKLRGSGYAYMVVDPGRFDPSGPVSGAVTVTLSGSPKGNRPGYSAAGSPATVRVHVAAPRPRDSLPTILWLWPESAAQDHGDPLFSGVQSLVANAPYYFSQVSRFGPISESLDPYSIIVLSAQAAAEGVLTQKVLLDYLSDGGALLFHGAPLEGVHYRDLSEWLRPLDIHVDMSTPVSGRFSTDTADELLRHWVDFTVTNGCQITDLRPRAATVRVANGPGAQFVFAARSHGLGRIALLAAPTPLLNDQLSKPDNRAFALDLFYWLSRAGFDISDRDGDGVLDSVENKNSEEGPKPEIGYAVDTNWLDPDTDRDGIPDGLEDTNRNGVVDPGETDPSRADSDGDGTNDGADPSPLG